MASVVVAEDNVEHQRAIAEVVRRLGHEVTLADDGRAGLAAVLDRRPDLVIADVDMPHLDGLQMCRAIRDDPGLATIPVVLLTGYLPPGDGQVTAAADAGAATVVRKPFSVQDLADALRSHLDPPRKPPAPAHDPDGAAAQLAAVLATLEAGVAFCDRDGRFVLYNEMLRDFFGLDSDNVALSDWPERFGLRHHDGSPLRAAELPLARALAGEDVHRAGILARDGRQRPRWLRLNARPVRDADGAVVGAVVAVHDVTGEHRARQYRECTSAVLRVLAGTPDTATAGEQMVRAIGTTLGWSYVRLWLVDAVTDRLRTAATYTAPEESPLPVPDGVARGAGLAGLTWERGELVWVPDIHAEDSPVLPAIAGSTAFRAAGGVPVRTGGRVTGVLTFFSDDPQEPEPALTVLLTGIAGNIGAYLEQRRAEEIARQLTATTDEYIALVGHELRTPLTSIGAYTELLADVADDTPVGQLRDLIEVVDRNSARLRGLVEQLLDLAALDSGYVDLAAQAVDLSAVVAAAVDVARADPAVAVHADVAPGVTVTGDPDRLRQVVDHLVGNAVKYTADGAPVSVRLDVADDAAVLTIADAGIGIPADEQSHLFRRLYRASNARHSGIPGSGLGLAFSRTVVERHRGSITVTPGQPAGTTVVVRLPRSAP